MPGFFQRWVEPFDATIERAVLQSQSPSEFWLLRLALGLAVLAAAYLAARLPLLAGEVLFLQLAMVTFLLGLRMGLAWLLFTWIYFAWLHQDLVEQGFFALFCLYGYVIAGVTARKFRDARSHELQMISALSLARQVQLSLQPPAIARCGPITMASSIDSFRELGGDLVCWKERRDESGWFFLVGDVMGKGAQAALTAAYVKGLFDELAQNSSDPADLLTGLHQHLLQRTSVDSFLCAVCFLADVREQRWLVCRAGFGSPVLRRIGGQVEQVEEAGMMLGLPFEPALSNQSWPRLTGDQWFIASDGLLEEETCPQALAQALECAHESSEEVALKACVEALRACHSGGNQDDETAVLLRW